MTRHPALLTALATVGAILAVPTSAAATTPAAAAAAAPPATVGSASTVLTLITGDRVAVSTGPDGRPTVKTPPGDPRGAGGSGFQVLTTGSHVYVIPRDAAASIGQPLDMSLFDVNALVAGGYADPAKPLDVAVTPVAGAAASTPPGMNAVSPGLLREPRDRAAEFGAALHSRSQAMAHGQPAGHLFDGIARMALAGAPSPGPGQMTTVSADPAATAGPAPAGTASTGSASVPPGQPAGQLYTLRVKVFNRYGQRAYGAVTNAVNVDDVNTYLAGGATFNGEIAYSVPAGDYAVLSFVLTPHPDGSLDIALVTAPQIAVTKDTEVVLDARRANPIGAGTPDPTTQRSAMFGLQRTSASGVAFASDFVIDGATPIYAAPTDPVSVGSLGFYSAMRLGDATDGAQGYLYDLAFPYTGAIPGNLYPVLRRDQLATIDARYHSTQPGRAEADARLMYMPWQISRTFTESSLASPVRRTEYVLPVPGMVYQHDLMLDATDWTGDMMDVIRQYQPGQQVTEDWATEPMAPGVEQETVTGQPCPACRAGDTLNVLLFPYTDNDGHLNLADASTTSSIDWYTNGTLTAQAGGSFAALPMSPDPAGYRLVLDSATTAVWSPTATRVHTEWDFSSAERPADPLPPGWTCGGKGGGGGGKGGGGGTGGGSGGCSFEPLLFLRYQPGAGLDDVIPAGQRASVQVAAAHQTGAAATPVTSLDASVSFDDGATWQPATAQADGDGRYTLSYPQPALSATSGFASLRVTATDAAGSRVTQTITRAYPLAVLPSLSTGPASAGASSGSGTGLRDACPGEVAAPFTRCMAVADTAAAAGTRAAGQPAGYGPADLWSAYRLPVDRGDGRVVAIVDAYDNPNAEADLNTYRARYGLPPCTTADGCFRKVNQRGAASPLPAPDAGWGLEIDLDLQAASAACPRCHILLVEADNSSVVNLGPGVQTAVNLGADVVSNSYGSYGEFSGEQYFERYYRQPVPVVVSSGDYGYGNGAIPAGGVGFPGASQYVTAVGGTSLVPAGNARGWAESAWAGSTSGCSAYIHKPGWQKDNLCGMRTVADVAAVADPRTGLAVYDSFGWWGGWLRVGGTSAAAPIIAGVYALAGPLPGNRYAAAPYGDPADLFDVVDGANGDCGGSYLCTATPGYDGPTGLGTPNGAGAF